MDVLNDEKRHKETQGRGAEETKAFKTKIIYRTHAVWILGRHFVHTVQFIVARLI